MKKYRTISSVFVLFILWQLIAAQMNNDFLFPYPYDVINRMLEQLVDPSFYQNVALTIIRSSLGLCFAFGLAFLCAYASYHSTVFYDLFYPILLLTRSVPNVAYIIIVLVWFGSEKSSAIVSFLIIFPTIFASLYHGLRYMDENLSKVLQLYPEKTSYRLWKVYIPLLKTEMISSFSNGLSLTFKVGVMAEILGQVQFGIGRQLNLCRITSDMIGIFAWTLWIILILLSIELLVHSIFYLHRRKQAD